MKRAKDFLTPEQMAIPLNHNAYEPDGSCIGTDLDQLLDKRGESLIDVGAHFEYVDDYDWDDTFENRKVIGKKLSIGHFIAWSETRVYIVLHSIFGDEYLTSLPRNPQETGVIVTTRKEEPDNAK